ncbi:unnamed protein product [Schistosoma mattheei]|uniref:Uncharacterized protein n=1 Tax=Schistosoma mattheei TaxID=31246 RepID=A0A183Q2X5_9TREM|nr:unnamed protein product [Schistosoma mattheei]
MCTRVASFLAFGEPFHRVPCNPTSLTASEIPLAFGVLYGPHMGTQMAWFACPDQATLSKISHRPLDNNTANHPTVAATLTWWSGLPIVMKQPSYTGCNQPFLKILPCQTGRVKSGKTKSNKPEVRRRSRTADCTEVFPSDNQHNIDAAFLQGGVGLEKVDPKNAHLALSHGFSSPAVRSQQVWS